MITLNKIDYQVHSIQIKDAAGDALAIGADGSLNVTDNGGSLTVDAVDLDIRDLAFATDKVDVSGSEVSLDAGTLAALENITVSATDLDIRNLVFATDKVDVSGSEVSLDSATLAALENITVSATDLDIRDLSHSQDSIKIGDGVDFLAVNADGSINVQTVEAGYGSWSVIAASVDTTVGGTEIAAAPLSGRLRIIVQNVSNKDAYLKEATGVTSSNGLLLPAFASVELGLDAGADLFAIASSGTVDLRIAQFAA